MPDILCPMHYVSRMQGRRSLFQADTSVQSSVKCLADIIFFCPVDTSGSIVICINLYAVQPVAWGDTEDVLCTYAEGMFGNKGDIIAIIRNIYFFLPLLLFGHIICKCSVGISVTHIQSERIGNSSAYGSFGSIAPALAGINRDTSESVFREFCYLLITGIL